MILKYLECVSKPKKIAVVPTKTVTSDIFNRFESRSVFAVVPTF